jgi:hypothetical protein
MITAALRERDMALFKQADVYESGTGATYNSDGGTDIEGSRNRKVSVILKTELIEDEQEGADGGNRQGYIFLHVSAAFVFGRTRRINQGESKKEISAFLLVLRGQGIYVTVV